MKEEEEEKAGWSRKGRKEKNERRDEETRKGYKS